MQDEKQHVNHPEPLFLGGLTIAQQKMDTLEKMWAAAGHKRHQHVLSYLRACFEDADDCYACALYMMSNASDFCKTKHSGLAYTIMDEFGHWVKTKDGAVVQLLSLATKTDALHRVLKQKNTVLVQLVCEIYQLSQHKEAFLELIRYLYSNSRFAEAAVCATSLALQDRFTLHDMVIPLILQDKINIVESYIKDSKELQVALVKFLDTEFNSNAKIQKVISQMKIPFLHLEKCRPKTISKLLSRFLKLYDISPECCPNLSYMRRIGGMKHLLYKKYTENSMTDNSWDEMIQDIIGSYESLQKELVVELVCNNDMKAALKWAEFYCLPQSDWPPALKEYYENPVICDNDEELHKRQDWTSTDAAHDNSPSAENWDEYSSRLAENYLVLRLPTSNIHFVETPEQYFSAITDISQHYDMVGVDAEWKPSFGICVSRVSLLQLAVCDNAYLFDILSLSECLKEEEWDELLTRIFCNPNLMKLGYSIHGDLQMLANSVARNRSFLQNTASVLDLEHFCRKIQNDYPQLFSCAVESTEDSNHETKGLSDLSRIILGSPLNKHEQFSDWEKRPLREAQRIYAALDAYCLLQIYEELYARAEKQGFSLDDLVTTFLQSCAHHVPKSKALSPKKKPKKERNINISDCRATMPNDSVDTRSFKVVVDTMLQGLGRHLRLYGVDTIILDNGDDHCKAAKIAMKEDRVILTSGGPFQTLRKHVPEGQCFNVPSNFSAKEQAEMVFGRYNVRVTEADIFTRCPTDPVPPKPVLENVCKEASTSSSFWNPTGTMRITRKISAQERAIGPGGLSDEDDDDDDDDDYCNDL